MNIELVGLAGSATAAKILDFMTIGSPCLFPDLAAFLARFSRAALRHLVSECSLVRIISHTLGLEEVVRVTGLHGRWVVSKLRRTGAVIQQA
jgi:hypothetical protein